jgi:hypothetical protein
MIMCRTQTATLSIILIPIYTPVSVNLCHSYNPCVTTVSGNPLSTHAKSVVYQRITP